MTKLTLLFALASALGCAGSYSTDYPVDAPEQSAPVAVDPPEQPAPAVADLLPPVLESSATPVFWDERVLYVNPDPRVEAAVQAAAEDLARFGFNIAIEDSIEALPIYVEDWDADGTQAVAHWSRPCFYDNCTSANSYIKVRTGTLGLSADMVRVSVTHELGHVISGWGACADGMGLPMASGGHLVPGNVISNGNTGYEHFTITEDDVSLLGSCLH